MTEFFRSLFGIRSTAGTRMVLGHSVAIELKDVKYIQSSKERLESLFNIYNRFKNTPYAPRVKSVYDKSKNIHAYLVERNRLHELEIFHIQNTEHFISAFTAILDSHQQKFDYREPEPASEPQETKPLSRESKMESLLNNLKAEKFKDNWNGMGSKTEGTTTRQTGTPVQTAEVEPGIPALSIPTVSINTFEKVPYFPENGSAKAIGYTSSPQEKFEFQQHLIHKLGVENIKYLGNSLLRLPEGKDSYPTGLVPVIHWAGLLYAVSLTDYRLFPVKTYRKGM